MLIPQAHTHDQALTITQTSSQLSLSFKPLKQHREHSRSRITLIYTCVYDVRSSPASMFQESPKSTRIISMCNSTKGQHHAKIIKVPKRLSRSMNLTLLYPLAGKNTMTHFQKMIHPLPIPLYMFLPIPKHQLNAFLTLRIIGYTYTYAQTHTCM